MLQQNIAALIERYDANVPRYTSYPTAPNFTAAEGDAVHRAWLADLPRDEAVSLYLHVPFCRQMCWYCGCHTQVAKSYSPVSDYVDRLIDEIDLAAGIIGHRLRVAHLHWGGGSPSMLEPADFLRLTARLRHHHDFIDGAEFAVEIDPRTLTPELAAALKEAGLNRASLGVQTFNTDIQAEINRPQPYESVQEAADRLRGIGVEAINLDLMYGLPGQTVADIETAVDLALRLDPSRLALFGYAHVPWMKPHQQRIDETRLPGAVDRFLQAHAAREKLTAAGYVMIGFDHFARADDELARAAAAGRLERNFQGYTDDPADCLVGFGTSSISSLPHGYVQNDPSFRGWEDAVREGRLPTTRLRPLSADDRERRAMIMRLMCDLAIDLDRFGGIDRHRDALDKLAPLVNDGLVTVAGSKIAMTDEGRPFLRAAAAAFDRYLAAGTGRHSRGT